MSTTRRGEAMHAAVEFLEGFARAAHVAGFDADTCDRFGLAAAFVALGFSRDETIDATERVMRQVKEGVKHD